MLAPRPRLIQPHPLGIEREYAAAVKAVARQMVSAYVTELSRALPAAQAQHGAVRADAWGDMLDSALTAAQIVVDGLLATIAQRVRQFGQRVNVFHSRAWQALLARAYKAQVHQPENWLQSDLSAWEAQNIALIQSIPEAAKARLTGTFQRAVRQSQSLRQIRDEVLATYRMSESRAELIARDQVGKLNGELSQQRQRDIGVTQYVWWSLHDERVRDSHRDRDGRVFKWGEYPIPGSEIRCRCQSSPLLPGLEDLQGLVIRR